MTSPWGYSNADIVLQNPGSGLSANTFNYYVLIPPVNDGVIRYGSGLVANQSISIGFNTSSSSATANTWRDDGGGPPHTFSTSLNGTYSSILGDAATIYIKDQNGNSCGHFTSPHFTTGPNVTITSGRTDNRKITAQISNVSVSTNTAVWLVDENDIITRRILIKSNCRNVDNYLFILFH